MHVERVAIAGSIRRRRPEVKDVELVCVPRSSAGDLFGTDLADVERVRHELTKWGSLEKSGDRYIRVALGFGLGPAGTCCDVFLVHPPAQWGTILAIRTGPRAFGVLCVSKLKGKGWRCRQGAVWRPYGRVDERMGTPAHMFAEDTEGVDPDATVQTWANVPTPTEAEFFQAADVPYVEPHRRDAWIRRAAAR